MSEKVKRPPKMFLSKGICKGLCLLSDEQAGRVIREACAMHIGDQLEGHVSPEGEANIIWQMLNSELNDNETEYQNKCEQNRQNQLRRWAKEGEKRESRDTSAPPELELEGEVSPQRRKGIKFNREKWVYTHIPQDDIDGWRKTYPGVDIELQIIKAQQWQKDNPKNVKKDHRKFLGGWMARAFKDVENERKKHGADPRDGRQVRDSGVDVVTGVE